MPNYRSDERFDFGFSEYKSHDKIVNILVFKQFTIRGFIELLQMIDLLLSKNYIGVDLDHSLYKNRYLIDQCL